MKEIHQGQTKDPIHRSKTPHERFEYELVYTTFTDGYCFILPVLLSKKSAANI